MSRSGTSGQPGRDPWLPPIRFFCEGLSLCVVPGNLLPAPYDAKCSC